MQNMLNDKSSELIAIRWAKALFELASENPEVSDDNILSDLRLISETLQSSDELFEVINNPSISTEEKQNVLSKLFENKITLLVYNFIFALNLKKRIGIIPQILEQFSKLLDEKNNIVHVNVISAIELNEAEQNNIDEKISQKLGKKVIIDWTVDNKIIAGLIFNIDETIVDNSVLHILEDLQKQIIKS